MWRLGANVAESNFDRDVIHVLAPVLLPPPHCQQERAREREHSRVSQAHSNRKLHENDDEEPQPHHNTEGETAREESAQDREEDEMQPIRTADSQRCRS